MPEGGKAHFQVSGSLLSGKFLMLLPGRLAHLFYQVAVPVANTTEQDVAPLGACRVVGIFH
jgi:hypothetical protein